MGTLSIVATPIGNLEDITLRALRTLKECDLIYAEDTRVISKLLARHQIKKTLERLDSVTEKRKAPEVLKRLKNDEHIAYVSDAGTPGISDPGARLVAFIRERAPEVHIEAIPGASALTAALSIAGLDSTEFSFLGFLPHKKGRQTLLKKIATSEIPVVLYESPHRVLKLLGELEAFSIARVTILRELTKVHEEARTGSPAELAAHFVAHPDTMRGEFVVIVEP
jgi:16S rRNA (cytidine1402-2'-O)-methyltransferase